jgi:hypothetical protein
MSLELLTITGYQDASFSTPTADEAYTVMINPDALHWNRILASDQNSVNAKTKPIPQVNLSFDLIIDCTGIVDPDRVNLTDEITQLEQNVYSISSSVYTPSYVKIQWGEKILFYSKLISCEVSYTLFKPDGSPLRAKISLSFGQEQAPEKTPKKKNWLQRLFTI